MEKNRLDCQIKEQRFSIFGLKVGITSLDHSTGVIRDLAKKNGPSHVCVSNTHVLVTSVREPSYQEMINRADWNLPDGVPLVWYARNVLRLRKVQQVAGPSLMKRCLFELRSARHFFYGSTRDTLDKMERIGQKTYPGLKVVGSLSPPFRRLTGHEKKNIISMINTVSPDIIWVALGAPEQERWMWETRNELERGVMIGVGAAFDYFVGNIKRPPVWLRRSGLEWLCRFCQEPRRLWKRYLITNSLFISYVLREIISLRHTKSG